MIRQQIYCYRMMPLMNILKMTDSRVSTVGFFVGFYQLNLTFFAFSSLIREKYSLKILSILLKNGIGFGKFISY